MAQLRLFNRMTVALAMALAMGLATLVKNIPAGTPMPASRPKTPPRKRQVLSRRSRRAILASMKRAEMVEKNHGNKIRAVLAKGKDHHAIWG